MKKMYCKNCDEIVKVYESQYASSVYSNNQKLYACKKCHSSELVNTQWNFEKQVKIKGHVNLKNFSLDIVKQVPVMEFNPDKTIFYTSIPVGKLLWVQNKNTYLEAKIKFLPNKYNLKFQKDDLFYIYKWSTNTSSLKDEYPEGDILAIIILNEKANLIEINMPRI